MNKTRKSRNCCILCLKTPFKLPNLTLHRFPLNEEIRNKWLNACGLRAEEVSPYRFLCSRHFEGTCYHNCGYRLKSYAIPTKYLKGQIIRPYFQLPEYETKNLRSKNDEINSSLQPSTSETVNVGSKLEQGGWVSNVKWTVVDSNVKQLTLNSSSVWWRYFTNTETSSEENNMENNETDTDTEDQ